MRIRNSTDRSYRSPETTGSGDNEPVGIKQCTTADGSAVFFDAEDALNQGGKLAGVKKQTIQKAIDVCMDCAWLSTCKSEAEEHAQNKRPFTGVLGGEIYIHLAMKYH